jgi:hypothetical protein
MVSCGSWAISARRDRLKLVLFNMRVNRTIDFSTDVKAVERAIRGVDRPGVHALEVKVKP